MENKVNENYSNEEIKDIAIKVSPQFKIDELIKNIGNLLENKKED